MNKKIIQSVPSPSYVIDEAVLTKNLKILKKVKDKTGCKILLALKGFAMFSTFPLIRKYLDGTTASAIDEARLGFEKFGKETHVCIPAYNEKEFPELMKYVQHVVFNSFSQWEKFGVIALKKKKHCSIRLNPEYGEAPAEIYNPCMPCSRLGVVKSEFHANELQELSGFHIHALCEKDSYSFERVMQKTEEKFGKYFKNIEYVNFGGGHHITRLDYDVEHLCKIVTRFKEKYGVQVYLEPGEAIAINNSGVLVTSVLDIIRNEKDIAILDTSAAAHMPDVLEMPYRPMIEGAGNPGEFAHTYQLGGLTCLASDVIGDYSFPKKLQIGDRIVFLDMAHYTMVKNNTFNGVRLPAIVKCDSRTGKFKVVRKFSYQDYKERLS